MRIRGLLAGCATGAVLMGGAGLAAPAQADLPPAPNVITNVRTGQAQIVSGSGQTTQFTVTVTNPASNTDPQDATLLGNPESGLTLVDLTAVNDRLGCKANGNQWGCTALDLPPAAPEGPQQSNGKYQLEPGETATVIVTYQADAWVPTSPRELCVGEMPQKGAPPVEPGAEFPCGIQLSGAPRTNIPTEYKAYVDVLAQADLQLTATGAPQTDPGKEATVSFQLKDLGPSLVLGYTITFTMPDGLTLVSTSPTDWKCTQTGQKVECVWDVPRAAGQAVAQFVSELPALAVTVKTPNPALKADYGITATATSNVADPTPANAAATGGIPMTPVDLAVAKSAGSPVLVGDEATYSVDVSNVGTIADLGKVTVTDTLPAGAVFKSATGEGWTCKAEGQKVTCTDDDPVFAAGTSEKITLVAQMTAAGRPENKAEVSTTAYEKNLANNSASNVVRVKRAPQTAAPLPSSPRRILSAKTDQGQKLTTRVRCTPVKASAAGEVAYCKVIRAKGVVKVKVFGSQNMKVKVVQTAKGTKKYQPFVQHRTYLVKP